MLIITHNCPRHTCTQSFSAANFKRQILSQGPIVVDLQLTMQSVPITTKIVNSNPRVLDATLDDKVCQ
jgi:hypothetical protein